MITNLKPLQWFLLLAIPLSSSPAFAESYRGIEFPAGASSFADSVVAYEPGLIGGPVPDVTQQDSRQILGVPKQGSVSLGYGGRIIVKFTDNALTGSDDSQPDLWIFEVGEAESVRVLISRSSRLFFSVGNTAGAAAGSPIGIDIDQYGFDSSDRFLYVMLQDRRDGPVTDAFTVGADMVAVGASSSVPRGKETARTKYYIQAHVGGRSELILHRSTMQWHHRKGSAPGLDRGSFGGESNSPTIVDSNQGPNIVWIPSGWPHALGNGTQPESFSSMFDALTPVFPARRWCWEVSKISGAGQVQVIQQPSEANDYALFIEFDDLKSGNGRFLSGSGFYVVELTTTGTECVFP